MKTLRLFTLAVLALMFAGTTSAAVQIPENQYKPMRQTAFGFGAFIPHDAETGWLLHGAYHWRLDNAVFHGPSLSWYRHHVTQTGEVWNQVQPGWSQSTYTTEFKSHLTLVSPQYDLGAEFDMLGVTRLTEFIKVSLGMDMLWATETNYEANASNSDFLFSWNWNLTGGAKLKLGDRTWLISELGYHRGKPSRKNKQISNLPTRTEINMSGFSMKIGISYLFWKQD